MTLDVRHVTEYSYSQSVKLGPHTLYLYPRTYPHQRLLDYELRIDPTPVRVVRNVDVEGNIQQLVYFSEPTERLHIEMTMRIESEELNSYDFLLFPFETTLLPFDYPESIRPLLLPYMGQDGITAEVRDWAQRIAAGVDHKTIQFLTALSKAIRQFQYEMRPSGFPLPPDQTLALESGSCRDYTVLFMAACRSLGLAARFVSGYLFGSDLQNHQLHAWAEVYLPGGGWRGFDPTGDTVVVNRHIFLASTATPRLATPISGMFSPVGTESSIETSLTMSATPESAIV
jgi:transglutaminase-like putative cysteine protease